jgi:predicted nucleotidyltransferase
MDACEVVNGRSHGEHQDAMISSENTNSACLATLSDEDRAAVQFATRHLYSAGARRVWLFGSLAKGRKPGVHSDFDFAVEGLPPEKLFGCVGHLLQKLPRPVDIVEMECASDFLCGRKAWNCSHEDRRGGSFDAGGGDRTGSARR